MSSDTVDNTPPSNTDTINAMATLPNNNTCPPITLNCASTPFPGEKLSKMKGNYHQWYEDMLIHLMGNCLFDYVEGDATILLITLKPHVHKNWMVNDQQAWSDFYIMDCEDSSSPGNILNQNIFQGHSSKKYVCMHNSGPGHEKYGLHSNENRYFV